MDRGIKHHHLLAGQPGLEYHIQSALSLHPLDVVVPVAAVRGPPVGGEVDPIGPGETDGVKGGVLLHPLQQLRVDHWILLAGAEKVGVVAHPQEGVAKLAFDLFRGLPGGILRICLVSALDTIAVLGCIPEKQNHDRGDEDRNRNKLLRYPFPSHNRSPYVVSFPASVRGQFSFVSFTPPKY